MQTSQRPLLIVVSAPSGAGKSTLCDRLLAEFPAISYSVSCTTRAPRGAEVDGEAYFFLTPEAFRERIAHGDFLEHATVHGNLYGTLRATVEKAFAAGRSVIMDIDVAGAAQVREYVQALPADNPLRTGFVDLFILPPSMEELRRRLVSRGEDAPETIELRLRNAAAEMEQASLYRHRIVNDDLDRAYAELRALYLGLSGDAAGKLANR